MPVIFVFSRNFSSMDVPHPPEGVIFALYTIDFWFWVRRTLSDFETTVLTLVSNVQVHIQCTCMAYRFEKMQYLINLDFHNSLQDFMCLQKSKRSSTSWRSSLRGTDPSSSRWRNRSRRTTPSSPSCSAATSSITTSTKSPRSKQVGSKCPLSFCILSYLFQRKML